MDTTDPEIAFDDKGNCNHCTDLAATIDSQREQLESDLVQTIRSRKSKGKYDVIIGISGGTDSCYVARWASNQGFNGLLVHLDNGWNSEVSIANIRKMASGLNFDFESVVLDWEEFRSLQLAFLKSSTLDLELPTDLAIPAVLFAVAKKHGVKTILSGGNYASEGILPMSWGYHGMKDLRYYNGIVKKYGDRQRYSIPKFGFWDDLYYRYIARIRTFYPLNYIDYSNAEAKEKLKEEFALEFPFLKHHESRYTGFWQGYILPTKYGIDYRRATYSTQICFGNLTREEALERLEIPVFTEERLAEIEEFVCKKLNLTKKKWNEYLAQPPKTFRDFKNSYWFLALVHRVYRLLKSK